MLKITGARNDLIEIDGDIREEFPLQNDDEVGGDLLAFSDGTVLRIAYGAPWRITPVHAGSATLQIEQEIEDEGTDKATLDGDVRWVVHGTGYAKA